MVSELVLRRDLLRELGDFLVRGVEVVGEVGLLDVEFDEPHDHEVRRDPPGEFGHGSFEEDQGRGSGGDRQVQHLIVHFDGEHQRGTRPLGFFEGVDDAIEQIVCVRDGAFGH